MKGTSKLIIGATLVMVVILAMVLGMIIFLLVEFYCSPLLRRRKLRNTAFSTNPSPPATPITTATANVSSTHTRNFQDQFSSPSLSSFYAQGVLQAPRSILFPKDDIAELNIQNEMQKQHAQLHQVIDITTQEPNTNPSEIGLLSSSPPLTSITARPSKQNQEVAARGSTGCSIDKASSGGEQFVYISNPIYDNEANRQSGANTPFETPDTSPSRLERSGSSGGDDDEEAQASSPSITPPLSPIKKLPAEACSVSLRDARSLGTSGSDSVGMSSSSSGSPCTSPSW